MAETEKIYTPFLFRKSWYKHALIFVICLLTYLPVFFYSLTGCDDKLMISTATSIAKGSSPFFDTFNKPYMFESGLFYRPVVTASVFLDLVVGSTPVVFHIFNIFYFICLSILVYIFLLKLNVKKEFALVFSLIFAVHPVFTNAVAWIPGRNDTLIAIFGLLSFICLIKYFEGNKIIFLLLNIIFFIIALFTKESALALAVMLTIYLFLMNADKKKAKIKILLPVLWAAAIAFWYFVRSSAVKETASFSVFKNAGVIIQGAGKILFPFNLSVLPTIGDTSYFLGILSIVVLIALFFISKEGNRKEQIFGALWFLIFMVPFVININPEYSADLMLECRLLLPAIGIFIMLANIFSGNDNVKFSKISLSVIVIVIIGFAVLNGYYSSFYKNDDTFWARAVENSPNLDLSHSGLGLTYLHEEKYEQAETSFKKAAELNPSKIGYNGKIGYILIKQNKPEEAQQYYEKEKGINPYDFDANLILGVILFKKGDLDKAEKCLLAASALNPNDSQPAFYLMKLYYQKINYPEALKYAKLLKAKGVKIPADISKGLGLE